MIVIFVLYMAKIYDQNYSHCNAKRSAIGTLRTTQKCPLLHPIQTFIYSTFHWTIWTPSKRLQYFFSIPQSYRGKGQTSLEISSPNPGVSITLPNLLFHAHNVILHTIMARRAWKLPFSKGGGGKISPHIFLFNKQNTSKSQTVRLALPIREANICVLRYL